MNQMNSWKRRAAATAESGLTFMTDIEVLIDTKLLYVVNAMRQKKRTKRTRTKS